MSLLCLTDDFLSSSSSLLGSSSPRVLLLSRGELSSGSAASESCGGVVSDEADLVAVLSPTDGLSAPFRPLGARLVRLRLRHAAEAVSPGGPSLDLIFVTGSWLLATFSRKQTWFSSSELPEPRDAACPVRVRVRVALQRCRSAPQPQNKGDFQPSRIRRRRKECAEPQMALGHRGGRRWAARRRTSERDPLSRGAARTAGA